MDEDHQKVLQTFRYVMCNMIDITNTAVCYMGAFQVAVVVKNLPDKARYESLMPGS